MEKSFNEKEFEELLSNLYEFVKDDIAQLQKHFEEKKKKEAKAMISEPESKKEETPETTYLKGHIEAIGSFGTALDKLISLTTQNKTCALRREFFNPDDFIIIDEMQLSNIKTVQCPILIIFYTDNEGIQHAEPFLPNFEDLFATDWELIIKD